METVRIVDLFAGVGGLRQGTMQAIIAAGHNPEVVFTSEIKPHAVATLQENWPDEPVSGDITEISEADIPSHDLLLAGFPCQAFSHAGKRKGFEETRGTLFFDVARILAHHKPQHFILENVEGLIQHDPDPEDRTAKPGRTMKTILTTLEDLGYQVTWTLLTAANHGVPQIRKRVFILGSLDKAPDTTLIPYNISQPLSSILESGLVETETRLRNFQNLLLQTYPDVAELEGKIFRDWRGGARNIHTWDIGYKGQTTLTERAFLEKLMVASKRTHWKKMGLQRVGEGFPLTLTHIRTFYDEGTDEMLQEMLDHLTELGYLKREGDTYRISAGRLTTPVSYILDRNSYANTLTAADANRLALVDGDNLRRFTDLEVKRLFGFPEDFRLPVNVTKPEMFDLFGNSVVIPVAKAAATALFPSLDRD